MIPRYILESDLPHDELVARLGARGIRAIVTKPELVYFAEPVEYAHWVAQDDFARKRNAVQSFPLQWLLRLCAERRLSRALDASRSDGLFGIASEKKLHSSLLSEWGTLSKRDFSQEAVLFYGVSSSLKSGYSAAQLIREKIAVAAASED